MGKIERIEVTDRWWRRHLKSSIPDLSRAITELVVNSADSYKRMNGKGKIIIEYDTRTSTCTVTDNAEGMSREKLYTVAKNYGGLTSGIESGQKVGGVFGVGLKEACLRMGEGIITTIKDGKLTQLRIFIKDGEQSIEELVFRNATESNRYAYKIPENGTQVKLKVPQDLLIKPNRLINLILNQWILRKILQNARYEIIFIDKLKGIIQTLQIPSYSETVILDKTSSINYNGEEFEINIKIFKLDEASTELFADCLLLVIYNEDVVAEKSLIPPMETDLIAANLRGEVYVNGFEKLLSRDESVLDEKRTGIDMRHQFNKKLVEVLKPIIREMTKQNRNVQKPNFDTSKVISKLNNIAKQELEEIDTEAPPRNFRPNNNAIGFYYSKEINLKEYEEKNVFLVINADKISEDIKLYTKSASGKIPIKITPEKVNLNTFKNKKDLDPDLKYSKIKIKGIEQGFATVTAEANGYSTDLIVVVKHNEILDIKSMNFLPDKYDFNVDKKYGYLFLYVKKDIVSQNINKIYIKNLEGNNLINTIKKLDITNLLNLTENILYYKIKVNYNAKVGDQTTIVAQYGSYIANAKISFVPPNFKNSKGLFDGIQDEYNESSDEIARVGEDIIYVNKAHPIIKYYASTDRGEKSAPY
ncbi:MAG: ATP-binding protein, partial [Minisyncoccia bacterium]